MILGPAEGFLRPAEGFCAADFLSRKKIHEKTLSNTIEKHVFGVHFAFLMCFWTFLKVLFQPNCFWPRREFF